MATSTVVRCDRKAKQTAVVTAITTTVGTYSASPLVGRPAALPRTGEVMPQLTSDRRQGNIRIAGWG